MTIPSDNTVDSGYHVLYHVQRYCHGAKCLICVFFWVLSLHIHIYHIAGKFGGKNIWQIYSFQVFGRKKFGGWIDQPKGYIIVTTMDDFSLANHRRFAKFTKLSPHQTFPLYGTHWHMYRQTDRHRHRHVLTRMHVCNTILLSDYIMYMCGDASMDKERLKFPCKYYNYGSYTFTLWRVSNMYLHVICILWMWYTHICMCMYVRICMLGSTLSV